jgi:hypothetical protein
MFVNAEWGLGMMIYHHCWDKACLKFMPFVMICCEKA